MGRSGGLPRLGRAKAWRAALLVALLPGLTFTTAFPVSAAVASVAVVDGRVVPDTPDQQQGSPLPLPSLVDTAATTSREKTEPSEQDPRKRKGGLPAEGRHVEENPPQAVAKSPDGEARLAAVLCASYPAYNSSSSYAGRSQVSYQLGIWTSRVEVPRFKPPGSTYYEITPEGAGIERPYWNREGDCADGPPPDPVRYPPTFDDVFPVDEMLVDSLTPLLVAHAYGNNGGTYIRYTFEVCDNADMTGASCFTSGQLAGDVNTWRVPAGKLVWGKEYWWTISALDVFWSKTATTPALSFTTGVRQPAIGSQLATSGVDGQEFHQLPGNYTTSFTDASVATAGPPLSIVRSYNAMDPRRDGMFGAGWSTRFDMKIQPESVAAVPTLLLTNPDGRQIRFASRGDGSYQPPPGMYATLVQTFKDVCTAGTCVKEPSGWRLMDKSSTSYLFAATGKLTTITDNLGRAQEFAYSGDGKLASVTSPGGRSLSFTWNGAHVATVSTPPVNGQPLTWTYVYQGDQLKQVCSPTAAPNCVTFDYTDGSLYRSTVLNSDPIGYWRLGEQTGTTAADLGWGAGPAAYSGATLKQPGALAGTGDTAVTVSGSQKVVLPEHALARVEDAATFETWFKTTQSGVLLATGAASEAGSGRVYVGTDGKLRGQLRRAGSGSGIAPITSTGVVNDGQWHHVAITLSAGEQRLYLDGQQVGTLAGAITGGWSADAEVGFGQVVGGEWPATPGTAGATTSFGFRGQLDEVAVYAKPLTPEDVRLHFEARAAAPYKMTKITLPSGRVWAANVYDAATDRLKTHTDNNGGTWQISALDYAKSTGLSKVTVTDPNLNTIVTTYDAWRGYRVVSRADQLGKITKYTYDTGGYPRDVIDPNGNVFGRQWTARGNLWGKGSCRSRSQIWCEWEWFGYHENAANPFDPLNDKMHSRLDQRSSSALDNTYATHWSYNEYGQVKSETWPDVVGDPTWGIAYTYTDGTEPAIGGGTTPKGLLKTQRDPKGGETRYAYTAAGDLAEETTPSGLKTAYTHDALGRVTSHAEISTAHPDGVKTTFTYDGMSRVATQTGPGVRNEISNATHTMQARYGYDADGNELSETIADLTGGDPDRTTSYTYDAYGRSATITGPEGGVSKQEWSSAGALVKMTNELGTVVENGYSKRGELLTRTLKGWTGSPVAPQPARDVILESYTYDLAGRLAAEADAMGRKTSYTYFDDNLLSQVIGDDVKLNGSTTARDVVLASHTYDLAGNLTKRVTGGGSAVAEQVVDAANRITSTTFDPAGVNRKTVFDYDRANQTIKETRTGAGSTNSEITEYAYNPAGIMIRQTIKNDGNDLVTSWTVDERGLTLDSVDPRGNVAGADRAAFTTSFRYDNVGQLIETKAPPTQIEKAGTSTLARATSRFGYNGAGNQTHVEDAEGRRIGAGYDRAGRRTSLTGAAYTPPGGSALTPTFGYSYDPAGRMTTITDPRGQVTSAEYDALDNPVRVTDPAAQGQPAGRWVSEYDLLGERLATIDPTGARSEATYDGLGRQITDTTIERRPTAAVFTTKLEYNDAGYLTKTIRPGNKATTYTVNAAGEVTAETDPLNDTTTYTYDPAGRPAKATNPLGNATAGEYDPAGRLRTVKNLNSAGSVLRSVSFGYDAAYNVTEVTSGEGYITRRKYDATDLLVELTEPVSATESITTSFGYDATGARTRLTDGRGNATWTGYNTLGLIETLTEPATQAHPNFADRTWTHLYDAAGNETALLQPGGVRLDRQFDHLNRITKISGSGAGIVAPDKTYSYDLASRVTTVGSQALEYNDRSLLTKLTPPAGTPTTFAYDALGNPTQRADVTGTTTYTWDNDNRLKTVTDPVSGRTNTYDYDKADRLTSLKSANPTTTQTYTYDALDRLETHTLKNSSGAETSKIVYGWDKDDNLTSKTTTGIAGAGTNTYGYDRAGRLTSWTAPGGNTTAYTWDASGNRTKAGDKTYTYDERNRLTTGDGTTYAYTPRGTLASETKNGTTKHLTFDAFDRLINDGDTRYTYDDLDRMTSRQGTSGETRFIYAGLDNDIIAVTDQTGAIQAKYGRDPSGGLLSLQEGTNPAVGALTDIHHDLIATYTGTAITASTAYNPFGEVIAQDGPKPKLGYQSEYTDPDTGKVNMLSRWYQPGTGAFASRDTWTLNPQPSIQANRYTYASGTPLTRIDPLGHKPDAHGAVGGGTGTATRGGANGGGMAQNIGKAPAPKYGQGAVNAAQAAAAAAAAAHAAASAAAKAAAAARNAQTTKANNGKGKSGTKPSTKPTTKPQENLQSEKNLCRTRPGGCGPKNTPKTPKQPQGNKCKVNCGNHTQPKPPCKINCGGTKTDTKPKPDPKKKDEKDPEPCRGPNCISKQPGDGRRPGPDLSCDGLCDGGRRGGSPTRPIESVNWDRGSVGIATDFGVEPDAPGEIIRCDTPLRYTGTCKDGSHAVEQPTDVGVVIPEPDYGDPPPPPIYNCDPPNSFVAGTKVLMADGSHKAIEDVKVGNLVMAADPRSGQKEAKEVTTLISGNGVKSLVSISIDIDPSSRTKADAITATSNHPFWVANLREWVNAGSLEPGMWLQTASGTYVQVSAIKAWVATRPVHNLTVDGLHTYYVAVGGDSILVHNDEYLDLYHGTSREAADSIRNNGVDPGFRPRPRDFGNGFYLTKDKSQAETWARNRYGTNGVVLHFRVPTSAIVDLNSKTFGSGSPDLADFLYMNRTDSGTHPYDVVEGPMLRNVKPFLEGASPVLFGHQIVFFGDRAARILDGCIQ
ncbi:LamG-like jellyroll fold domain-containing protein [Nonomuraea sp. NPDC050547]|uniref:LamG-like jellyroll fold domain-containing protein n=1 Tax=Nonomuraea sp. NPDC050547 TaxID=3364368 RepID=UPI0037B82B47